MCTLVSSATDLDLGMDVEDDNEPLSLLTLELFRGGRVGGGVVCVICCGGAVDDGVGHEGVSQCLSRLRSA